MVSQSLYPFAENRPDLLPVFIDDPEGKRPFGGFQFLEGTVLLAAGAQMFENRQLRCLARAILGQSNRQIANAISKSGPKIGKGPVEQELSKTYKQLPIPRSSSMRVLLFPACLALNVFEIPELGFGNKKLYPITPDMLPIVRGVAQGSKDDTIAAENGITKTSVASKLSRFGEEVGFYGRESHALAALITKHVSLDEVWPPAGYPLEPAILPSPKTPLYVA